MLEKTPSMFRPISTGPLEANDEELALLSQKLGMPVLRRPEPAAEEPSLSRSPTEKLTMEIPDYLALALRKASAESRMSVRHIVILALNAAGYEVQPQDLVPDGRRLKAKAVNP